MRSQRRRRWGRFCAPSPSGMSASSTGCSPRRCVVHRAFGAGPGDERLVVDVDSFVGEVYGYEKQGAKAMGTRASAGITRSSRPAHRPVRCCTSARGKGRQNLPRRAAVRRRADPARRAPPCIRAEVVARRTRGSGTTRSWPGCRPPAGPTRSAFASRSTSRPLSRRLPSRTGSRCRITPQGGEAQIAQTMLGHQRLIVRRAPDWSAPRPSYGPTGAITRF